MANKNNSGNFIPMSSSFISQLLLGLLLTLVFSVLTKNLEISIFLGVLSGLMLGILTNSTTSGPRPETVATSDGVDAGVKFWLFFLVGFLVLGRYDAPTNILLSALAGFGGGWIFAWWGSKEEIKTQPNLKDVEDTEDGEEELSSPRSTAQRKRRTSRRYRRRPGMSLINFWNKDK